MFYDPRTEKHGLKHSPVTALVVPRPIGWISTLTPDGVVNLGPYSFFNLVSGYPPWVIFSSAPRKHSQTNAETSGEFVFNLATSGIRIVTLVDFRNDVVLLTSIQHQSLRASELPSRKEYRGH